MCARDGGDLPPPARADRRGARAALSARMSLPAHEKALVALRGLRRGRCVRRVAVVGGGLAGISAALDCAGAGAAVTLVEVRRRLGGAAYSFERDGLQMDNGQHVFLRCCEAYRGLLERLGSSHLVHVQERLDIPVLSPGNAPARIRRSSLHAPLHLAGALARYPRLSARTALLRRARGARAGAPGPARPGAGNGDLRRLARAPRPGRGGDRRAVGPDRAADAERARRSRPRSRSPRSCSARACSRAASAGDIGFHVGTLQQILGDPARSALEAAGVELRLGWRAEALARGERGFELQRPRRRRARDDSRRGRRRRAAARPRRAAARAAARARTRGVRPRSRARRS